MDVFQHQRCLFVTQSVACTGIFHAYQGHNLARTGFGDLLALLGLDAEDATHTLALGFVGVIHAHAVHQLAAEDTDEGLLTDVGVVDELEGQGGERLVLRGVALAGLFLVVRIVSDDGAEVLGRGQVIDDGVEQQLDAFVLIGRAAEHGHHHQLDGGFADGAHEEVGGDLLVVEVQLSHVVVDVGDLLDEVAAGGLGLLHHGFRDGTHDAFLLDETHGVHLNQVDHAFESGFGADGKVQRHGVGTKVLLHLADDLVEVGTSTVHLVDKSDTGHPVFVRLVPDGFTLGLHAANGAKHGDHTVDDAQRALHLDGEVHVARSIDEVDLMVVPVGGDGRGGDGYATLLLLFHEVHGSLTVMGLTHFAVHASEKQNTF